MNGNLRRGRRIGLLAAALLLSICTIGVAQSLESTLDRGAFSQSHRAEITELFAEAMRTNIPEALLLPRLTEGVAKRVPAARIISALESETSRLLQARSLLSEMENLLRDRSNWARAANLLNAGLDEESVRALGTAADRRPWTFRPASALLVSLVDWGLAETEATALAVAVATSELQTSDYPVVLELLIEARAQRVEQDETVRVLLDLLPNAESTRALRRAIRW